MLDPSSDEAQLANELSENPQVYQYGKYRQRRWYEMSAGAKVILVASCLLWLVMLAVTLKIIGDVHDLKAVAALVFFGLEALAAIWLSRLTWRYIGAGPRIVLRFLARTWFISIPLLLVMIGRIAAPYLVARDREQSVAAGATVEQSRLGIAGAVRGENWKILVDGKTGYQAMSQAEARAACEAIGPDWKLPAGKDLETLRPPAHAPDDLGFWLAEAAGSPPQFSLTRREQPGEHLFSLKPSPAQKGSILCLEQRATLVAPKPAQAIDTFAADFYELIKTELQCSQEARAASVLLSRVEGPSKLLAALTCWENARQEEDLLVKKPTGRVGSTEPMAAVTLRSLTGTLEGPADRELNELLESKVPLEAQAAELALSRWAAAYPKQANRLALELRPGEIRKAHAFAAGAGALAACEYLAREIERRESAGVTLEALKDLKGPCASAAAKVLLKSVLDGMHPNEIHPDALTGLQALGAAAAPEVNQLVTSSRLPGASQQLTLWLKDDQWLDLLEAELRRRTGIVPPRGANRDSARAVFERLGITYQPCTAQDFGLTNKQGLPWPYDRCLSKPQKTSLLRDGFVPLR